MEIVNACPVYRFGIKLLFSFDLLVLAIVGIWVELISAVHYENLCFGLNDWMYCLCR